MSDIVIDDGRRVMARRYCVYLHRTERFIACNRCKSVNFAAVRRLWSVVHSSLNGVSATQQPQMHSQVLAGWMTVTSFRL